MGYDAVVDSAKLNGALTATADAIRRKTYSAEPIKFDMDEGFKSSVEGIASGGVDTSADTVTPSTLVKDYTAHDAEGKPIVGELDLEVVKGEGYTQGEIDGYNRGHIDGQEAGYNTGYEKGNADGYSQGHADGYNDGLAKRTYEVWTITLADGSVIEKDVALL